MSFLFAPSSSGGGEWDDEHVDSRSALLVGRSPPSGLTVESSWIENLGTST